MAARQCALHTAACATMQLPNLPSRVCKLTVSFKDFNVSHLHKGQTIIKLYSQPNQLQHHPQIKLS